MKPKSITKPAKRKCRTAKKASAADAIGKIEKNTDTFILTYGQFSLIDALCAILDQVGPSDVTISAWTAADAHLERSAALMESAQIKSFKMIIDGSFATRQPGYCSHMRTLFGDECIRAIKSHAKFMLIRSETHNIVVRTSMNLNENPRLENIEISEDETFAEFFQEIVNDIFKEMKVGSYKQTLPELENVQETFQFPEIQSGIIKREDLNEPRTTHTTG